MKILQKLLGEPDLSIAIVEVEKREPADLDEMLRLVDDIHGDYSVTARFVTLDEPPRVKNVGHHEFALSTPGPQDLDSLRDHKRYYEVCIKHARR